MSEKATPAARSVKRRCGEANGAKATSAERVGGTGRERSNVPLQLVDCVCVVRLDDRLFTTARCEETPFTACRAASREEGLASVRHADLQQHQ